MELVEANCSVQSFWPYTSCGPRGECFNSTCVCADGWGMTKTGLLYKSAKICTQNYSLLKNLSVCCMIFAALYVLLLFCKIYLRMPNCKGLPKVILKYLPGIILASIVMGAGFYRLIYTVEDTELVHDKTFTIFAAVYGFFVTLAIPANLKKYLKFVKGKCEKLKVSKKVNVEIEGGVLLKLSHFMVFIAFALMLSSAFTHSVNLCKASLFLNALADIFALLCVRVTLVPFIREMQQLKHNFSSMHTEIYNIQETVRMYTGIIKATKKYVALFIAVLAVNIILISSIVFVPGWFYSFDQLTLISVVASMFFSVLITLQSVLQDIKVKKARSRTVSPESTSMKKRSKFSTKSALSENISQTMN